MTGYIADLAPDSLPAAEYTMVDKEQAACIEAAMEEPGNQADFEVTLLPLDTPEQRRAAAEEWSACKQAIGEVAAHNTGAFTVISSRDESPEGMMHRLEEGMTGADNGFIVHSLLRVVKIKKEARVLDLLRAYYDR